MSNILVKRIVAVPYPNLGDEIYEKQDEYGWLEPRINAFDVPSKWLCAEQYSVHADTEALSEQIDDEGGIVPTCIRICDGEYGSFAISFKGADREAVKAKLAEWHPDWDESYMEYASAIFLSVDIGNTHEEKCWSLAEDAGRDADDVDFRRGELGALLDGDLAYDFQTLRAYHSEASFATVDDVKLEGTDFDEMNEALGWSSLEQLPSSTVVGCLTFSDDDCDEE